MFYNICYYFLIFFGYSVLGWCVETIAVSFIKKKMIWNRGFLIGPYCPIYGWSALFMVVTLQEYYYDPIVLFILACVGATVIEYITSFVMEKMFNARWWDYSDKKFNINGRVCLENAILFGLLGVILIYFVHPVYSQGLSMMPITALEALAIVLFVIFLIDNIISFNVVSKLKLDTKILQDSTAEINAAVRAQLRKGRFFTKRLLNAFPSLKTNYGDAIIDRLRKILDSIDFHIQKERDKAKRKAEQQKEKIKKQKQKMEVKKKRKNKKIRKKRKFE